MFTALIHNNSEIIQGKSGKDSEVFRSSGYQEIIIEQIKGSPVYRSSIFFLSSISKCNYEPWCTVNCEQAKMLRVVCSTTKNQNRKKEVCRQTKEENKMMWASSYQGVQIIECLDYQG